MGGWGWGAKSVRHVVDGCFTCGGLRYANPPYLLLPVAGQRPSVFGCSCRVPISAAHCTGCWGSKSVRHVRIIRFRRSRAGGNQINQGLDSSLRGNDALSRMPQLRRLRIPTIPIHTRHPLRLKTTTLIAYVVLFCYNPHRPHIQGKSYASATLLRS